MATQETYETPERTTSHGTTMKAVVFKEKDRIGIEEMPKPRLILGHEPVGVIDRSDPDSRTNTPWGSASSLGR